MLTFNGKVVEYNSKWFDNFLPIRTARIWFYNASFDPSATYPINEKGTWTRVSADPNIWDFHRDNGVWSEALAISNAYTNGGWEVLAANLTGVHDTSYMFWGSNSLKAVHNLITPNMTTCHNMFQSCEELEHIDDFDTSQMGVDTYKQGMTGMFQRCLSLKEFPHINTAAVHNFDRMFMQCESMVIAPKIDLSSATYTGGMFNSCISLVEVPEYDTHNVMNMDQMFQGCTSLVELPDFDYSSLEGIEWPNRNVGGLSYYCSGCISLEHVPDLNIPNCDGLYMAFTDCRSLKHIPAINCKVGPYVDDTFKNCVNAESGILDSYNYLSSNQAWHHDSTFMNCGVNTETGSAELAQIPNDWKGVS